MIWVITSPERINEEAIRINHLMPEVDVLLLRKAGWTPGEYAVLLEQIQPRYRHRIMIAEQPDLLQEYGLMGLHISERTRLGCTPQHLARYAALGSPLSTSIHQPHCPGKMWRHLLLGPVFDSISKPGYTGKAAQMTNIPANALAIGGIAASNAGAVSAMGFSGVAVLGAIWQGNGDEAEICRKIKAAWNAGRCGTATESLTHTASR